MESFLAALMRTQIHHEVFYCEFCKHDRKILFYRSTLKAASVVTEN